MKQLLLLISFGIVLFFAGCETIELDDLRDFELTIEQESDTILQLSWTKANLNSFKKYVIVRSAEPITSLEQPSNGFVLAEISDFNQNSLTDIVTKLSADYYYRVYVELENKHIVSNQEYVHFDETYSLFVSYFIQADQVQFTWKPSELPSFKRFILAFSDNSINIDFPAILNLEHTIISSANINTATHTPDDLFSLHYKLLLDLGDRVISTESLATILPNSIIINEVFEATRHNTYNDKIYFWKNGNNSTIEIFDYAQEIMLQSINAPSSDIEFSVNRNQQQDEIYIIDNKFGNNREVYTYNADNLSLSHSLSPLNLNSTIDDIKVIGNWVFLTPIDNARLFSVYDRTSGNLIYSNSISTANFTRKLAVLDEDERQILELSKYGAHTYTLDSTANLAVHKNAGHSFARLTEVIAVSPDKQYFAGLENGLIYNSSLTGSFYLQNGLTYKTFAFSENSDKLYAAADKKIYKYDIATRTFESQINNAFPIHHMFIDDGKLVLIGHNKAINPDYTIIKKIDL